MACARISCRTPKADLAWLALDRAGREAQHLADLRHRQAAVEAERHHFGLARVLALEILERLFDREHAVARSVARELRGRVLTDARHVAAALPRSTLPLRRRWSARTSRVARAAAPKTVGAALPAGIGGLCYPAVAWHGVPNPAQMLISPVAIVTIGSR